MALPHFRISLKQPGIFHSAHLAYLQAARNYTILYFEDGSREVYSKTLKLFEASLPAEHFVRISKSYLVRRDYIDGYVTKKEIRLKNGVPLKVARRRKISTSSKIKPMLRICFLLFFQLSALLLFAQTPNTDVIYRTDNTTLSGTVLEITDDMVDYRKPHDATIYRLSTKEIQKIVYASGEVENYERPLKIAPNRPTAASNGQASVGNVYDSQPYKNTIGGGLGIGGSIISSIPINLGYSYQILPRITVVGSFQRALWANENGNFTYRYSSIGAGIRLYSKPTNLTSAKLKPFFELGLGLVLATSIYSYDILKGSTKDTEIFPVPGFAVGCLINTTPHHGAYAKMNLGPLSITPLSLIDVGYTFKF